MQPCLQNQGYSVGYLAATCVKDNVPIRKVDIKKVQKYLVKIGNLPERVLTDTEFKGFSSSEMEKAASTIGNNYEGLEILLSDNKKGIKAVRRELRGVVSPEAKLNLASFLCMLGYDEEADALVEAINNYQIWDKGWHYTGSGQFGMSASRLDALITALGHSKHKGTVDVVLNKANLLKPEDYFSHFRAVSMALEDMADPRSAETLAAMLCEPGVMHHSISDIKDAKSSTVPGTHDTSTRNIALKELHLARALFVSGDKDKMGENVLKRYADGMQAHYARYASNALAKKK
jgi:hypothetical protein